MRGHKLLGSKKAKSELGLSTVQDLKPANLLISSEGVLQIADLGLGRVMSAMRPYTHQVATRWYRAPELLYGARNYTGAVDMWAAGCILAELYNKTPLFLVSKTCR